LDTINLADGPSLAAHWRSGSQGRLGNPVKNHFALFAGWLACGGMAASVACAAAGSTPPTDAQALYERGLSFYKKGQAEEAIADFTAAIATKPDFLEAYVNRGENYQTLKQYDKAVADYDQALKLRPNYAVAINDRGSAEYAQRKLDAALADFNRALEIDPRDPFTLDNRGWLYLRKSDWQKAEADFAKGLALTKNPIVSEDLQKGLAKAKGHQAPSPEE
jgi:tetratricopeptide (TPR) repeat protein